MRSEISGKVWKLGDDIDTDIIIPTQYLALETIEEMKEYAFNPLRPELSKLIAPGDVIVAGKNFGCGSSREQAPEILAALGVGCVIAKSYARIFYRNAFANGLLLLEHKELPDKCNERDFVSVDLAASTITLTNQEGTEKQKFSFSELPANLLEVVEAGGLVPFMREKNKSEG